MYSIAFLFGFIESRKKWTIAMNRASIKETQGKKLCMLNSQLPQQ